jgi:hypothetical protein
MRRDDHKKCKIVHEIMWNNIKFEVTFYPQRLAGLSQDAFNMSKFNNYEVNFLSAEETSQEVYNFIRNSFIESHQFDMLKKLTFPNEQA